MGEMRILKPQGDLKVMWDAKKENEVKAARDQFERLTRDGKYKAYSVKKEGEKDQQINKFDPDAEKIILAPAIMGGE